MKNLQLLLLTFGLCLTSNVLAFARLAANTFQGDALAERAHRAENSCRPGRNIRYTMLASIMMSRFALETFQTVSCCVRKVDQHVCIRLGIDIHEPFS